MNDLDLLIELQKFDFQKYELKDKLEKIEEDLKLEDIKAEYKLLEDRVEELDIELIRIKGEVLRLNRTLKDNYFNIDATNDKLYDGSVRDIKQLDILNEEQLELKIKTDKIESEALIAMEKEEIISKEKEKLSKRLKKLLDRMEVLKKESTGYMEEYNRSLERIDLERNKVISKLSEDSLKYYNSIKCSKKDFIAELKDNRCMGCHMSLPTYIIDKVKSEILIKCENCNRILYLKK